MKGRFQTFDSVYQRVAPSSHLGSCGVFHGHGKSFLLILMPRQRLSGCQSCHLSSLHTWNVSARVVTFFFVLSFPVSLLLFALFPLCIFIAKNFVQDQSVQPDQAHRFTSPFSDLGRLFLSSGSLKPLTFKLVVGLEPLEFITFVFMLYHESKLRNTCNFMVLGPSRSGISEDK